MTRAIGRGAVLLCVVGFFITGVLWPLPAAAQKCLKVDAEGNCKTVAPGPKAPGGGAKRPSPSGTGSSRSPAKSSCPPDKVPVGGACCWPNQVLNNQGECVGEPVCPPGYSVSGNSCVLQACEQGQEHVKAAPGRCCWPRQGWSSDEQSCVGTPQCPEGMRATRSETCEFDPVYYAAMDRKKALQDASDSLSRGDLRSTKASLRIFAKESAIAPAPESERSRARAIEEGVSAAEAKIRAEEERRSEEERRAAEEEHRRVIDAQVEEAERLAQAGELLAAAQAYEKLVYDAPQAVRRASELRERIKREEDEAIRRAAERQRAEQFAHCSTHLEDLDASATTNVAEWCEAFLSGNDEDPRSAQAKQKLGAARSRLSLLSALGQCIDERGGFHQPETWEAAAEEGGESVDPSEGRIAAIEDCESFLERPDPDEKMRKQAEAALAEGKLLRAVRKYWMIEAGLGLLSSPQGSPFAFHLALGTRMPRNDEGVTFFPVFSEAGGALDLIRGTVAPFSAFAMQWSILGLELLHVRSGSHNWALFGPAPTLYYTSRTPAAWMEQEFLAPNTDVFEFWTLGTQFGIEYSFREFHWFTAGARLGLTIPWILGGRTNPYAGDTARVGTLFDSNGVDWMYPAEAQLFVGF